MSAVEAEILEAEIIESTAPLDAATARNLTRQIRVGLEGTHALIIEAFKGRAWKAMGYPTWDAYCQGEFGTLSLQPPREDRQQVIGSLREAGMSVRAIAASIDMSKTHVTRELQDMESAGVPKGTADTPITGLDGKTYSPRPAAGTHFMDIPLDEVLLDMSADDLGIGLKEERTGPRVAEKPKSVSFSSDSRAVTPGALGSTLNAVTESAKAAFAVRPQQGELFPTEDLLEASRSIVLTTCIVADATIDVETISDADKAILRGDLQDAVDRLNQLLDRLEK